ncbi:hypothetical protein GDO86_014198 [Hymenochirus boettgeri]|uniref:NID domain-containing protein n=1 Tax=Hymenochirus boettgeri TaxID=247094 RepID=A0A8T2JT38_9PIPI|nr:hypothetical protein GDO86_014198 [Hymenochirus boettgeri]
MNIIKKKCIEVPIEKCRILVNVNPVELFVLDSVSVDVSRSSKKILISNLPPSLSEEVLLDKLELFFSKSKNNGEEVESREYLSDMRSVILTFAKEEVVHHLTEKRNFQVPFGGFTQDIHVTASIEGNIENFTMKNTVCNRTVLITGIPNITESEDLQDMLEIYFQKPSNGGGEVQTLLYSPEGHYSLAIFEDDEKH